MDDAKAQLLRWIDEDREEIVEFLCDFVRAKSPNPPGDTTLAATHVTRFLEREQLPFRIIAPQVTMPNIVGSFEGARPGPHLVLNGHIDVFPADEANERWTHGPWSGGDRRGQDLRPRGGRHESGDVGLDLHLPLSSPAARAPRRTADAHRRLRRGDLRPLGRPLPDGASPGGSRRLPAERRAEQPP